LGVLLARRGDMAASAVEMRKSVELQPKDPAARSNLGHVLEKLGDSKGAIEAYRAALELAPDDASLKAQLQRLERGPDASAPAEGVIKVAVRQVLVPVIVTNKEGHHVTG